jgi:carboxyl-terminal processing protease
MNRRKSLSLVFLALIFSTSLLVNAQDQQTQSTIDVLSEEKDPLPLQDLRLFTLIFDHIRRSYVEPVSDQELLENAVKGMLQELDPHSDYLNAKNFNSLQETTQGEFTGVGIEIGSENGFVKIITPIDDTPADKAGLQAGDLIIKLDNESIRGLSLSEAAKKMRGPKDTPVVFTIIRKGQQEPIDITVVRGTIKSQSVRTRILEKDFGYIRISQFQANTGKDFVTGVSKLFLKNKNLKGFVLDLRNNPGGVLQASVEVVDALINKGLIVYTEGRLENTNQSFSATTGDITKGLPIVVLINGGSASAAEIVAGALQDQKRAIIMGTRSFGKGSVQTILPVGQDKGIKLTTALYYTPNGRSIQAEGIKPDVVIKRATITQLADELRFKESDLSGHLTNKNKEQTNSDENSETKQNTEDNQLFEAVNMLKGLSIFHHSAKK